MPYDPRPISRGGNRGIDRKFSRKAPKGKFRVIAVDTFDGSDWVVGDFESFSLAKKHADEKVRNEELLKTHIYDDTGYHRYCAEKF